MFVLSKWRERSKPALWVASYVLLVEAFEDSVGVHASSIMDQVDQLSAGDFGNLVGCALSRPS